MALTALLAVPAVIGMIFGGSPLFGGPVVWGWDLWATMGIPLWLTRTIAWLFWIGIIVLAVVWLRRAVLRRGREYAARPEAGEPGSPAPEEASGGAEDATDPRRAAGDGEDRIPAGGAPDGAAAATPGPGAGDGAQDASDAGSPFADRTEEFVHRAAQQASDWGQRVGEQAGRWGEEVGRQADEWSARYAAEHDSRKPGVAHTVLTLALALLAGGVTAVWLLGAGEPAGFEGAAPAPLVGALIAALAVFALSLIVAGVRGKHTDWIGFLSACGVVALLFTAVLPWGTRFQPFGSVQVGTDAPGTAMIAGSSTLDLTELDGQRGAIAQGDRLQLWQLAGNVRVELPEEHPVVVTVRVLAGNIGENADGPRNSGPFLSRTLTANLPRSGDTAGASHIDVYLLAGNVRVNDPAGESGARSGGSRLDDADRARANRLEDRLALVEWQLEEPGLRSAERRQLEDQRDELRAELKELEEEMAR
ncbi:hypothetical protein [Leucobacter massiliensis]|uniref:Uncharacterized protein n=1 Tax=Leucobacter massiliensis TaxID=1686285 RepID=A0A2S9QLU7_9MICO|nr:hypothetical protein [Leucobacter massiliensis]PRI10562.1 hypothetical protein B4915_11220 [Leucobacter massiliensis]